MQELRAKLRVLEAKRADESRTIEKLESQLAEANSFVALRPKLQAKLNSLQQENIAFRRQLADQEQLSSLNDSRAHDAQEQLEMAMLDKEVAEERAEAAEAEVESLQERLAGMEVELESLKEGGIVGDGQVDDSVKQSLAYTQLEKHNERLKEALIRSVSCRLSLLSTSLRSSTACVIFPMRLKRSSATISQILSESFLESKNCTVSSPVHSFSCKLLIVSLQRNTSPVSSSCRTLRRRLKISSFSWMML